MPARPRSGRRRGGGRKVLILFGVAVLGTVGTVVANNADLRNSLTGLFRPAGATLVPYKVTKQKLVVTVTERGNLESSKNEDVVCEVEGQTTIISILPEGTRVKKGDLVCELDSAALKDNLVNQEIATRRAKADYENALKTREVAEIAVDEYLLGTFKQDELQVQGDMKLAESELQRSDERLRWSQEMLKKRYISESQVLADQLSVMKADISKRQAEKKMEVLLKYTRAKQETELKANVDKAKSDELAKEATFKLEQSKLEKLQRQIEKTKLYAPNDGLIVYANDTNQFRGNNQPLIEEGAVVRERQKIFSLPDISNMQVNTKVHESMVDRVESGQKAKIRVDAFANTPLTGTVKSVQPLPDPTNFFSSDIKVYTTLVTIDQSFGALRPGMTAEVTILIDTIENALCIPVTAVLPLKDKDYVYLITPQGPVRKEIKLGETNDILIEIKEGLKEGDLVAMNPTALLSEAEKNEAFSAASRAGSRARDFGDMKNPPKSPGQTGPADGKAKGGDAKGKRGGGGGRGGMAIFQQIQAKTSKLPPEEQAQLKDFSLPMEERQALMKKAGVTDEEQQQLMQAIQQMRQQGGGGGGFGGPGGGGPPGGGGFRGPGGGGPPR
jgi:HlyD family secretion protein